LLVLSLLLALFIPRELFLLQHLLVAGTIHMNPFSLEDWQIRFFDALRIIIVDFAFIHDIEVLWILLFSVLIIFAHEDDLGRVDDILIDHLLLHVIIFDFANKFVLVVKPGLVLLLFLLFYLLFQIAFSELTAFLGLIMFSNLLFDHLFWAFLCVRHWIALLHLIGLLFYKIKAFNQLLVIRILVHFSLSISFLVIVFFDFLKDFCRDLLLSVCLRLQSVFS
jgi:hypothetical protein